MRAGREEYVSQILIQNDFPFFSLHSKDEDRWFRPEITEVMSEIMKKRIEQTALIISFFNERFINNTEIN